MTIAIPETDLERIRQTLLEKHAELSAKLNKKPDEEASTSGDHDENMRATAEEDAHRKSIGLKWAKERLEEVEGALRKIEDGSYGICEDCEGKISIKRLEAYPNTTLCITCKEKKEKASKR